MLTFISINKLLYLNMKHEVSSQPNINSEINIQSINNVLSGPHVLKFISILINLRNKVATYQVDPLHKRGRKCKGMERKCIKVNYNMKCLSENINKISNMPELYF